MELAWPQKTREMHNQHIDSTVWNDFKFRDDDIIISTYAKSGTTWMQQIIAQMLFAGDTEQDTQAMSPWIDFRLPPKEVKLPAVEAQTHRRFVKTHLPVEALVYSQRPGTSTSAVTVVTFCGVFTTTISWPRRHVRCAQQHSRPRRAAAEPPQSGYP